MDLELQHLHMLKEVFLHIPQLHLWFPTCTDLGFAVCIPVLLAYLGYCSLHYGLSGCVWVSDSTLLPPHKDVLLHALQGTGESAQGNDRDFAQKGLSPA